MTKHKPPTIKDVAARSGVSIQTVSAVINGKAGITVETTARVNSAIQELGYRPYSIARSLRTGQTRTIALIVTDIYNPSLATIASAAEDVAHSTGYSMILFNTHDDPEREASYVHTVSQRWIDGVIFVATGDEMTSLKSFSQAGIPTVAIDRIPVGYSGPSVTLDNNKAGRLAADHLLALGHRRLAHISGPSRLFLARERLAGFEAGLREFGLATDSLPTVEGDWTCVSGYSAMQQILCNPLWPTAVFSANDRMAIGAILAAREAGLQVPEEISIIGLDDIEVTAFQSPPLTTIRQSFSEMASLCVHLLIDIIEGKAPETQQYRIEPTLVVRQSTSQKKDKGAVSG